MKKKLKFDINKLVEEVVSRPAPASCMEIEELFLSLPPRNSLIKQTPTEIQNRAFELLKEKIKNPTADELRYMAEICSFKYHRIRPDECIQLTAELVIEYYELYYYMTGSLEVKYILDNFSLFRQLCFKSATERQRKDDLARYKDDGYLSTSRDVDSTEWS